MLQADAITNLQQFWGTGRRIRRDRVQGHDRCHRTTRTIRINRLERDARLPTFSSKTFTATNVGYITLGLVYMTSRSILAVAAFLAIFQSPCSSQELPPSLSGRWQYLQSPDTKGEVLDLVVASDHWRGIMNGLERAGEHGLFYYVVEIEKLAVAPDGSINFEIGERDFFTKRPPLSQLGGKADGGFARPHMRFSGRIVDGDLVLQCNDEYGSCPDSTLRFKRLASPFKPNPAFKRDALKRAP